MIQTSFGGVNNANDSQLSPHQTEVRDSQNRRKWRNHQTTGAEVSFVLNAKRVFRLVFPAKIPRVWRSCTVFHARGHRSVMDLVMLLQNSTRSACFLHMQVVFFLEEVWLVCVEGANQETQTALIQQRGWLWVLLNVCLFQHLCKCSRCQQEECCGVA